MSGAWKHAAVPNLMHDIDDVFKWKENELAKLEVSQKMVTKTSLYAPRYTATELWRGDMSWCTFKERYRKRTSSFKITKRIDSSRLIQNICLWYLIDSKWMKNDKEILA